MCRLHLSFVSIIQILEGRHDSHGTLGTISPSLLTQMPGRMVGTGPFPHGKELVHPVEVASKNACRETDAWRWLCGSW